MKYIIKDEKGRSIIQFNEKGIMSIARYPDMDEDTKEYIIQLYNECTGEDMQKTRDFLEFKNRTNELCS